MNLFRQFRSRFWDFATRFGNGQPAVLLFVLLILAGSCWAFVELAGEVIEGDTDAFDKWVVTSLRNPEDLAEPIGPKWAQEMGRDFTALGGTGWLVVSTATVLGYLLLDRRYGLLLFVLGATSSGLIFSALLKSFFSRPRPDVVPHLSHVATTSFPSQHSMLSAVVYLTLAAILATIVPRRRLKLFIIFIAILLTVAVGLSRVYLGVHYPTDVLAGWTAGFAWALGCWMVTRWLQMRGQVEVATEEDSDE